MGELQKIQFSGEERVENEESAALYKALENGNNALVYIENIHKLSETEKSNIREGLMASAKKSKAKIFISISAKEETVFINTKRALQN